MIQQRPTRLVALTAVVLGCAACGGNAANTSVGTVSNAPTPITSGAPPAPATYAAAVRALGAKFGAAMDGLYPLDSGTKGSDVARATTAKLLHAEEVVVYVEKGLSALHPPQSVAVQQRTLLRSLKRLDAQIQQLATATRDGDASTFNRLSQLPQLRSVSNAAAAMKKRGYDVLGP
jgi:hypothetical protein